VAAPRRTSSQTPCRVRRIAARPRCFFGLADLEDFGGFDCFGGFADFEDFEDLEEPARRVGAERMGCRRARLRGAGGSDVLADGVTVTGWTTGSDLTGSARRRAGRAGGRSPGGRVDPVGGRCWRRAVGRDVECDGASGARSRSSGVARRRPGVRSGPDTCPTFVERTDVGGYQRHILRLASEGFRARAACTASRSSVTPRISSPSPASTRTSPVGDTTIECPQ
jgi:hypothetical protein